MLTIIFVLLAFVAALLPVALLGGSDARSRAVAAAELIALGGCEHQEMINRYRQTEVMHCSDDGITVYVQTRTRIPLPDRVNLVLYVHAQARAVHAL